MNLLYFGDPHTSDRAPAGRIDDYSTNILNKLIEVGKLCVKYDIQYAVGLGDIFHSKRSNRVSDYLRQRLISIFKGFPCPVGVVPGNHDLGPDELASLSRQPLGTLEKAGAIQILLEPIYFKSKDVFDTGVWLIPRPYSEKGDADPDYYALTEVEKNRIDAEAPGLVVMVAHGSILPPGGERPYPCVNVDTIPGIEDIDLLVSGHLHENMGIYTLDIQTKPPCTYFANLGSLARTARTQANYSRQVQVLMQGVTNDGTLQVQALDIPGVLPALEVFEVKNTGLSSEAPSDEVENLVKALGKGLQSDTMSWPELLSSVNVGGDVKQLVQKLLEEAEA